MNKNIDKSLIKFLNKNKILTLCVSSGEELWAASCIFSFNEIDVSAIISTSHKTRHASMMTENNIVAGTIGSKLSLLKSMGIQYRGVINLLEGERYTVAKGSYLKKYPYLKNKVSDIWKISFDEIKLVSMTMGRHHRIEWLRDNHTRIN
ncbi:PNPOx family protein [Vibrio mangrovi]|uniref:Pyridoxamine 5'-phosphate oxidase putative domain-containing protein n=1 Tax=Vibrio mangrovi TaxID=474394 RepID=A0A1Y6IPX0_9VIBR|nr:hypothetical protein [Vibrio mangrovi]MDW6003520.1 hypothetical protein [Vibrio mangrovi]SMR99686.1 hypothetical protein VIM7927_00914 [Vibrio mangrovi]